MNTMEALKLFLLILSSAACIMVCASWLMLFFLRLRVRQKRHMREEAQPRLFNDEMIPHR